ncbi:MAG: phosphocholine cytidylyltransferase/choline kinase family protein [Oscillospiraceae bacterium]|nr:phosphocholine cytidylyltransferase/choline kinase family protein [Oscillospiraceae bacterium]
MKPEHFVSICRHIVTYPNATQRELATATKLSLGLINSTIKECVAAGYLKQEDGGNRSLTLTSAGQARLDESKVKNAIILAAGFGSRFVPLTYDTPKGLLEVYGQPMIERQIEQLIEKDVNEIIIVVGYKKESFDYLIDKYGVKLVYNPEYATKNNLSSLYCVKDKLSNSYVLMSDFWIEENMFNSYEPRNWYSCIYYEGKTNEWCVTASASDKVEAVKIGGEDAWVLIGPAYFTSALSDKFKVHLEEYYNRPGTDDYYWEQILIDNMKSMPIYMNRQTGNVHEFENLEELRMFDHSYNEASNNKIMKTIAGIFKCSEEEIRNIKPIKLGMTNHSFTFTHDDIKYIMRIPGEGTDKMIKREQEYSVYQLIAPLDISDNVIFIDPKTGYKVTEFIENARVCDPLNTSDVKACMARLKEFHNMKLSVDHTFDIFERIEYYENLWLKPTSYFRDYQETKNNVMKLKPFIDTTPKDWILTHIDAVPDNFLFIDVDGERQIRLIDWEYTGMQDPHVDIAMFAIYAMYDREQVEALIDSYFTEGCPAPTRKKIYAYIAMCGLLWSNWCEYKSHMGVEFGEYSLRQYRFAKDYYKIFNNA